MKKKVYVTNPGYSIFFHLTYGNYHLKGNKVEMGEDGSDPRSPRLDTKEEILNNAAKELLEMIFVAVKAGAEDDYRDYFSEDEDDEEIDNDLPLNQPTVNIVIDPDEEFDEEEGEDFNKKEEVTEEKEEKFTYVSPLEMIRGQQEVKELKDSLVEQLEEYYYKLNKQKEK